MKVLKDAHLENHSAALVHGVSVQLLAFPSFNIQSRHKKCAHKKWRPRKPVWILCGFAPAAEPYQEEPVSTKHPRLCLNTTASHQLRCFCPDCWWALHEPNIRIRSMLPVLFTSVTSQQRLNDVSPLSLIIKVCCWKYETLSLGHLYFTTFQTNIMHHATLLPLIVIHI